MMTIKRLKGYDVDILKHIIKCEQDAQTKYLQNNELEHYRMSLKTIAKIEKIIDEKTK